MRSENQYLLQGDLTQKAAPEDFRFNGDFSSSDLFIFVKTDVSGTNALGRHYNPTAFVRFCIISSRALIRMPFSSERLLRELDQPEIIDWALELKNHKESVAFLKEAVKGEHLNPNQFRNALHALYRLAFPEDTADVLQVFVDLAGHPKREIRSQAVQFAIAILRVLKDLGTPFQLSVAQERALRSALALGVNASVSRVARRFFDLQERNS